MSELPLCRWRGARVKPDWYMCSSPRVRCHSAGVPASQCQSCTVADHAPRRTPRPPCRHLGDLVDVGPRKAGAPGRRRVALVDLHVCSEFGTCTVDMATAGQACCATCRSYTAPPAAAAAEHRPALPEPEAPTALVAPLQCLGRKRPWEGAAARKPWHFDVTAVIPHLETPWALPPLIDLLRLQTIRPYVVVIDTGSSPSACEELEALRAHDVELHYVKAHGYLHSSAPVTTALDVAFALCRTPFLFSTHSDVYPRRKDLLEWLLTLCNADHPVVGYEMSPRLPAEGWRGAVSHTCTMLHMKTMRMIGATWSFERYWESGKAEPQIFGFPDTEQPFDLVLQEWGIRPLLIGHEQNHRREVDDNVDHVRSMAGVKLYARGTHLEAQVDAIVPAAIGEARARAAAWREPSKDSSVT